MPEPEDDTRRQHCLPFGIRGDDLVHQGENPVWVVGYFYVNVKFDVLILWLLMVNINK